MTTELQAQQGLSSLTEVEQAVLRFIRQNPGRSRSEIAAEMSLSKSMLTKAVAKFEQFSLIHERRVEPASGDRGQPPVLLSLNADAFRSIGLYFRDFHYVIVRSDLNGNIETVIQRSVTSNGLAIIAPILADMAELIATSPALVLGIGQAVPGIVTEDGSLFEITPSQAELPLNELASAICAAFSLPLYWDNGAYCVAAFEASRPEHNRKCVFYLTLDYGVGGGLAHKGVVFRGAYNQASNIGALVPQTGPRPGLSDLAAHMRLPLDQLDMEQIRRLHENANADFMAWLDDRGSGLSVPLATVVQLFNPDTIIIGGFFPREVLEHLRSRVNLDVLDTPGRRPLNKPPISLTEITGPEGLAAAAALLPVSALLLGQPVAMARH